MMLMLVNGLGIFILSLYLLNRFADIKHQRIVVIITTLIGWYTSFMIIFLLPLDITHALYKRCVLEYNGPTASSQRFESINNTATTINDNDNNNNNIGSMNNDIDNDYNSNDLCGTDRNLSDHFLLTTWRIMYWTSQLLTWLILPILQSYSNAGEFSIVGKLRSAAYNNVVYYGLYLGVFVALLIYAASQGVSLNAEHLKVIIISASNTWGLFVLVVLLGYALVEVPRQLMLMVKKEYRLNKTYFDIDKLSSEKNEAEEELRDAYQMSRSVLTLLRNEYILREYAQTILAKFPTDIVAEMNNSKYGSHFAASAIPPADESIVTSEKYLIRLHKRVIKAIQNHHRTQMQWQALLKRAFYLEDVQRAFEMYISGGTVHYEFRTIKKEQAWLQKYPLLIRRFWLVEQYAWHVLCKRALLMVIATVSLALSIVVAWSECTFFIVRPTLSLAAHLVNEFYRMHAHLDIPLFVLMFYLCVCAYYSVFKMRIYRYYRLDSHHMTDENSLLFSATLLCRLAPALCLNVLGMIHLDSHISDADKYFVETQFTKLMGHLDVIPILAKGINIYLPIFVFLIGLGTYLRVGTLFLHYLGIDQFFDDDEMSGELVQGGRALVTIERNKLLREMDREQRDKYWANRLVALHADVSNEGDENCDAIGLVIDNNNRSDIDNDQSVANDMSNNNNRPAALAPSSNYGSSDIMASPRPTISFDDF
ncbi:unnamed protein product [Anisakis simplex]|uniref:LMBR1 domain-containing protein 2 n=1 Tax=Anisakis simplex TaxID=6269 RepID=A0A0M3JUL8_ANISI|nr:unnamed protein product [Anisakis simplex]